LNPETSWNQSLHVVAVNKGLEDEGDSGCEEEASVPSCKRSQPGRFWSVKTLHQDDIFIHLFLCDVTAICHIRPYLHDDNALDMLPVKESPTSNRQKRKEQIRPELRFLMSKLIKLTWCFLMFLDVSWCFALSLNSTWGELCLMPAWGLKKNLMKQLLEEDKREASSFPPSHFMVWMHPTLRSNQAGEDSKGGQLGFCHAWQLMHACYMLLYTVDISRLFKLYQCWMRCVFD
jgi:hypothetical protein